MAEIYHQIEILKKKKNKTEKEKKLLKKLLEDVWEFDV